MKNLWLGTFGKGVKVIKNITSKTVSKECEEVMLDIPNNPVRVITPYNDRTMLIGIDGFGVYQASRMGGYASPLFSANEGTDGVLHGNGVYQLLPSKDYKLKDMGIRHFADYILPWNNDELLFCTHDGVFDMNAKKLFDETLSMAITTKI